MAVPTGYAAVFAPTNIAGLLLTKTDTTTPLFNQLGGATTIASREFLTGADYSLNAASTTGKSETASLTAPDPSNDQPVQVKNVTQIQQKSVAVTYRKQSDTDTLTGLNVAGSTNNVTNPLAFELANRVAETRNDIEKTIIAGTYNLATTADEVDQTRGFNEVISTNTVAAGTEELGPDMLISIARQISTASPFGLMGVLGVLNAEQIVQLNKLITDEGQRFGQNEAGSNLLTYLTPFGRLNFLEGGHRYQPNGTAGFYNLGRSKLVFQTVPGKGNFFYEPLAKTGAAETGQTFGQWGLDHGHEWVHGKITGIKTSTAATTAPKVFVDNDSSNPVYTDEVS